jgi:hypothetical protein
MLFIYISFSLLFHFFLRFIFWIFFFFSFMVWILLYLSWFSSLCHHAKGGGSTSDTMVIDMVVDMVYHYGFLAYRSSNSCSGMSFHTKEELLVHQRTKWHFWNLQAKKKGLPSIKYTLSSTYWSEVYDSIDGSICYYNKMTGEIVKSEEPPMEMQANDIMMELLVDQQQQQQQPVTDATTTGIESSSTQEGGVVETYLYNGSEGQYDTYDTYDATTTTTTTTTGEIEDDSSYQVDYGNYYGTSITSDNNDNTEQQQFSSENSHEYYYSYYDYSVANGYDYTATDWSASTAGTEENGAWQQPTAEEIDVAWEEVADEQGNVYFYNRITYESSWTRPEKMSSTNNTVLDTSL